MLGELEQRLDGSSSRALADAVVAAMAEGVLVAGTRLPPIRIVARELGLSPTTVSAAWALLRRSATIRTDGRRGTVVVGRRSDADSRYRLAVDHATTFALDLSTGVPDEVLLPDLRPALRSLSARATRASYLDDAVLPELVTLLRDDWPYAVGDLSVHDGAMDALELVARTVVGFGDRVVVENPGFPPLVDLLESLGATLVPVPIDESGLRVDALAAALRTPVTAVFLQPRAHNPTGVSLTPAREKELALVVGSSPVTWVVEDDSAGAVASSEDVSLGRHVPDQVVHVRSFAKSHGPDLRLAALSAPPVLLDRLLATRRLGQGWTSRLLQQVLIGLLTQERSVAAVAAARAEYRRRRQALTRALAVRGVTVGGDDGINLWVPVADETAAVVRLAARGIGVAQGSPFWLDGGPPHVRLTSGLFAGVGDDLERLADEVAAAARVGAWSARR